MTMPEQIRLRARWGPRKDTVEDCAHRMNSFLLRLAECDEVFTKGWLKCTRSMDADLKRVAVSVDELRKLFEKGRIRRDKDKSAFEDMGFHSGRLWNGSEVEPTHVSVECGSYYVSPRIVTALNNVWLELPSESSSVARLLRPEKLSELVSVVVDQWNPDWVWVSTNKADAEIYQENPYVGQMVGWLTYASDRYGKLPQLPSNCHVTRIEGHGNLITIDLEGRLTASNSLHVASLEVLSHTLREAGFLNPIPPLKLAQQ